MTVQPTPADLPAAAPPPPPGIAVPGAPPAVVALEQSVSERSLADRPLTSWALTFFVLSPVTFGIYWIVTWFKRLNRVDAFIGRKTRYYDAVLDYTQQYADQKGRGDEVRGEIASIRSEVQGAYGTRIKPLRAGRSFLLTMVTFGVYGIVVQYRLNRVWDDIQNVEQRFDGQLGALWYRLGLTQYQLSFQVDPTKKRSFGLYYVLSMVTFGIYGLVWDHRIHTDPDALYPRFHSVEDFILQTARVAR